MAAMDVQFWMKPSIMAPGNDLERLTATLSLSDASNQAQSTWRGLFRGDLSFADKRLSGDLKFSAGKKVFGPLRRLIDNSYSILNTLIFPIPEFFTIHRALPSNLGSLCNLRATLQYRNEYSAYASMLCQDASGHWHRYMHLS